jgi:hypothetical protein
MSVNFICDITVGLLTLGNEVEDGSSERASSVLSGIDEEAEFPLSDEGAIKKRRHSRMAIRSLLQGLEERLMRCWGGKIREPEEKNRRIRNPIRLLIPMRQGAQEFLRLLLHIHLTLCLMSSSP